MTSSIPQFGPEDRWPLYRRPRKQFFLPTNSKLTHLAFPTAKRSTKITFLKFDRKKDLYEQIFEFYNQPLSKEERETYGNFVGEHIATRRHEILDCDPWFSGLTAIGRTGYLVIFDARFEKCWCLAEGWEEDT
jgi:hypothetical protein